MGDVACRRQSKYTVHVDSTEVGICVQIAYYNMFLIGLQEYLLLSAGERRVEPGLQHEWVLATP
jgi:hypothetical protein